MPLPTLEEMTAWTVDEIEAAIRQSLPPGVEFEGGFDRQAGQWFVRLWKVEEGAPKAVFEDWGIDKRIAYFNAYGWIWARQQTAPSRNSPWSRRREVTPERVQRRARAGTPDPADIDPEEIAAVYAAYRGQPKKG